MEGQELRARFNNFQQFLQHALYCSDVNCILPLCVNTKLKLKHSQVCRETRKCVICQEMKSLALKHSEYCVDYYCRIPFCMEAKLNIIQETASQIDLSDCLDAIFQDDKSWDPQKESTKIRSGSNVTGPSSRSTSSSSDAFPNQCQMSSPSSELGMNKCPPMPTKEFLNSSHLSQQQLTICQSAITVAREIANPQQGGVMGPYPASNQSTLTTSTETAVIPLFVKGREKVVTSPQDLINLPFLSTSSRAQAKNLPSQQSNQNSNKRRRESIHQTTARGSCRSSRKKETFGTGTSLAVCLNLNSIMGRQNAVASSQSILLKVRFMNALYSIMRMTMNTKTRGELSICVSSLKSALNEVKTLHKE